jgi:hypothetical protein
MAVSLGFGILFATAITLVLVPGLYLILEDFTRLFLKPVAGAAAAGTPAAAAAGAGKPAGADNL